MLLVALVVKVDVTVERDEDGATTEVPVDVDVRVDST